jgi:hypothetical protein
MANSVQIRVRRDTLANWQTANPTLADGEVVWVSDTRDLIAGPGAFNDLWTAAQSVPNRAKASADSAAASAASATAAVKSVTTAQSAFRSLRTALDSGRPACFMWIGDSTGDSDGTNPADLRTPTRLAQTIAAAYPNYYVMSKTLLSDGTNYGAAVTLQPTGPGRRFVHFGGDRSIRHRPADYTKTKFTTGSFDIRVLYKPDSGWVGTANRVLVARRRVDTDGGVGTSALEQFRFLLESGGTLRLDFSTNGTSLDSQNWRSNAITASSTSPLWLRATLAYSGGNATATFYTSPDGQTWTSVGTVGPYAKSPLFDASAAFFEVGAEGWQPGASGAQGNVYEVEIRDGVNGPTIAPVLPELWERYGDANAPTYGGSPTLVLLNASRSGTALSYHMDATRLPIETANWGQQVVVFNDSHNETSVSGPAGWISPYRAWVAAVQARLPLASIAVVLQNPHTSAWVNEIAYGYSHLLRLDELRTLAGSQGWGIVDLFGVFTNDPRGLTALIQSDGLHPTQDGYALAAKTAARALGMG